MFRTTHAPPKRKFSYVPQSIADYFAAQGKALTLNRGGAEGVADMAAFYRFPVTVTDLGEGAEEMLAELKQAGYEIGQDSTIRRADCLLFYVDEQQRQELRDEAQLLWHQQKANDYEQMPERLNEEVRRIGGGARFEHRGARRIGDFVSHGAKR